MNQIDYENLGSRMKELRIKMKLIVVQLSRQKSKLFIMN